MREILVNDRWPIVVPDHRAARPEWPWHEASRFASMHDDLTPGSMLWDVGTELGDHAAVYASWGLRLVLIEPNPAAWPCIAATIEANQAEGQVAAWWFGFVTDTASGDLDVAGRVGAPGTRRGWPEPAAGPCTERAGMAHLDGRPDPDPYPVQPATTVDVLVAAGFPPPDAMTIDVEGAELKVIRGAIQTIREHRPRLWISVHPELMAGYGDAPTDLSLELLAEGYVGTLLDTDHEEHWRWVPPMNPQTSPDQIPPMAGVFALIVLVLVIGFVVARVQEWLDRRKRRST